MKNRSRAVISAFTIITITATLFFAACAPRVEAALPSTPEPTISVTAAPTTTSTATPTAIPTPAVDEYGFTEERKAELNQQFQDFLNKQGEFTPEKISSKMMNLMVNLDKDEIGLGIATDIPEIQGYFFDCLEKDERIFLFVGFDGKDGKRFITPLEIPFYFYEKFKPAGFGVVKYSENDIKADTEGKDYSDDKRGLLLLLSSLRGKVILLDLAYKRKDDSPRNDLDLVSRDGLYTYREEVNSKLEIVFGLYEILSQNGVLAYTNPEKIQAKSELILKVNNSEEMGAIEIKQVPIIMVIGYYSGEFSDAG